MIAQAASSSPIDDILAMLDKVQRAGNGWIARCPAHDDGRPSLSVAEGEAGQVLLNCFAGCSAEEIVTALDLTMADLFPHVTGPRPRLVVGGKEATRESTPPNPPRPRREVTAYDYTDADGTLLYQAVRYDPKGFSQRRPNGTGGWVWSLQGVDLVPYRLLALLAADRDGWVFKVEGEKDADNLAARGLVATTNAMGANAWRDEYADYFRGLRVAILPDNDQPGRDHAENVAAALDGIAAEVRVVHLPDLPEKGDVSDWLIHHDASDLLEVVNQTLSWRTHNSRSTHNSGDAGNSEDSVNFENGSDWEEPTPLTEIERPDFPTHLLPDVIRSFVEGVAVATQTPPALAAMLTLSVIAAAAAKRVAVEVRTGWIEAINIFAVVVLGSGNRKSAVFAETIKPLEVFEAEEIKRLGPEIAEATNQCKIAEQALAKAQRDAANAKDDQDSTTWVVAREHASRQAREFEALEIPEVPRYLVDDCSPERLASLMARQDGRIAAMSPEGGIFELMAGRYSANAVPNLDVYLKGHAGDTIRVDRVGRLPEFVTAPALTLGLAVQPDVLRGLHGKPGFRGRGLLARIWYALPGSLVGQRVINPPPLTEADRAAYDTLIRDVLALKPLTAVDGSPQAHAIPFSRQADARFLAFEMEIECRLGGFGDLAHIADWGGKLAGAVARLAGIIHVAEHAGDGAPWETPISGATMADAITMGHDFLVPHALAAFGEMGADPAVEDARHVLRWLDTRHDLESITRRDLHQSLRRRFPKPDDLDPAITLLVAHGYLRETAPEKRPTDQSPRGRKPSPRYDINPLGRPQNSPSTQYSGTEANSVYNVNSVDGSDPYEEGEV